MMFLLRVLTGSHYFTYPNHPALAELETSEGCLIVLFFCLSCLLVLVLGDQLLSKLSLPLTVPRQKTPHTNQSQQQKLCLPKVGRGDTTITDKICIVVC